MSKGADIEKAYALIIGISEYKDPGIRRLNYTHADAEGIFKLLTDPKKLGISMDNIKILLDRDATLFNIKDAISNWLYKSAEKDSVVFIFFAGHGGVEEVPPGIEKDNLAKYLLPFDSVLDNLYASALSNRDFNDLLLRIRSKKLVIFMDSCYSGGVSERIRDVKITDDPYKKLGEGEGRLVIAASQPDQRSYEDSRIGHGVFTDNLLKALSGAADWDNDGYVTVLDAYKYLQDSVPRDAMKLARGEQEPIFRGDMKKDFVISIDRERLKKDKEDEIIQMKISKLLELRNMDKLSGKQYARLREIVKTDFDTLSDKDKNIAKLCDDFFSEEIPITAFIEDLGIIESKFEIRREEKETQEHERRLREEEIRILREKEREKALKEEEERKAREKQLENERRDIKAREKASREAQLKAQEMANRLEEERLQRLREEEERAQREKEDKRITEEKEQPGVQREQKRLSYNKLLVAASVLGILLLGYWMIAPGLNDSSKIPDTTKSTPSVVATIASLQNRIATIETRKGIIKFELYEKEAPITTKNFIDLAENGFYDGLTFHRVEPGFVIQGGDPKGDGTGGSGKTIPLEIAPSLTHKKGAVGMARSQDENSASSQFYICIGDATFLDKKYAVFGQVIEGQDVAEKIEVGDRMLKVTIGEK